jgi:cation transport regulator ChaC
VGLSGANPDYVLATHDHLVELGIADHTLDWLAKQLRS